MRFFSALCLLSIGISQVAAIAIPMENGISVVEKRNPQTPDYSGLTEAEYDTLYGQAISDKDNCLEVRLP